MILRDTSFNGNKEEAVRFTFHGTKYVEVAPDCVLGGPGLKLLRIRSKE
jgi:hypothetical protein